MVVLSKSATHGDIQVMYAHASVGNKSLGEMVTAFARAVPLEAPNVVSIDIEGAFAGDGKMIHLPTT